MTYHWHPVRAGQWDLLCDDALPRQVDGPPRLLATVRTYSGRFDARLYYPVLQGVGTYRSARLARAACEARLARVMAIDAAQRLQ